MLISLIHHCPCIFSWDLLDLPLQFIYIYIYISPSQERNGICYSDRYICDFDLLYDLFLNSYDLFLTLYELLSTSYDLNHHCLVSTRSANLYKLIT